MAMKLAESCFYFSDWWKVKLMSNEIGYIAEENTKQNVKGAAWFLLFTVK